MLAITLISWYQRRLSPLKGFSCPHRLLHRGDSCSQYAKRVISRYGLLIGLRLLHRRFDKCRHAAEILNYQSPPPPAPRPDSGGTCQSACSNVPTSVGGECTDEIVTGICTRCSLEIACDLLGGACG